MRDTGAGADVTVTQVLLELFIAALHDTDRQTDRPIVRALPPQAPDNGIVRAGVAPRKASERAVSRGTPPVALGNLVPTDERAAEARTRFHRGCRAAVAARQAAAQALNSKTERIEE